MDDLQPLIDRINAGWSKARQHFIDNPAALQSVAPGMVAEQIDEALTVVWNWLGRKRAPKGFRPMYQVGRVQLLTTLQALANHADNLPGAPAGYIQGFLTSLAGAISPLATLSLFRDKEDLKESLIALDADLTQHLALMETAQRELEAKTEHLARAGEVIGQVEEWAAAAEASSLAIQAAQQATDGHATQAQKSAEAAAEKAENVDSTFEEVAALKGRLDVLLQQSEQHNKALSALEKTCQAQQVVIQSILPNGAAAGLAHSFNRGSKGYQTGLKLWGGVFLGSVSALVIVGCSLHATLSDPTPSGLIIYFLHRLPWAGPLIWLGWFAAVQYGNVLRVKEDYAFKEATAIAFAGFRDHMEHLVKVDEGEGRSAMENLAIATIHNLGTEPLRLLQKQTHDASPLERLMASIFTRQRANTAKGRCP